MPTIETLTQVLRTQADAAAEGAPELLGRVLAPRRPAVRRRLVPVLAVAMVGLLVVAVTVALASRRGSSTGTPAIHQSTGAEGPPLIVSTPSAAALTHEAFLVRAQISNVTAEDLQIAYPIKVVGPHGEQVRTLGAVVTAFQVPPQSGINSDEPVPPRLARMPRGQTETLWLKVAFDCGQLAAVKRWPDSFPTIRIALAGSRQPVQVPFSDLYDGPSMVPGRARVTSFGQLLAYACSI